MVGVRALARYPWPLLGKEAARVPDPEKNSQADEASELAEAQGEVQPVVITPEARQQADLYFDRAEQATMKGNFDYAIHLFVDGLKYNPLDVERGHKGLREAAIKRRGSGRGTGFASMFGQFKGAVSQMIGRGKDAMMDLMESATADPQNVMLLMQIMQTARRLGYIDVAIYYGESASDETLKMRRPQKQVFTTLAEMYESQKRYQDAIKMWATAKKIDPADRAIDQRLKNISATGYTDESGIETAQGSKAIRRDDKQAQESARQNVMRTKDQLDEQYDELKALYEAAPTNVLNIQSLADCEVKRGHIEEALALLAKALEMSKDYRFKFRMDDVQMQRVRRQLHDLDEQLTKEPERADLKAKRHEIVVERDEFELAVFTERQQQYPTDANIRFELGVRQYRKGHIDDAIVSLQVAARDPKNRVRALNVLGKCFFNQKFLQEAQSQFETAIQQYELTSDPLAKELRYNLAMCFEAQEKHQQAADWYSDIVQQDYQYRDAAKRLAVLRKKLSESAK
jgi:tetratricopeptide (TPR) repeat protein